MAQDKKTLFYVFRPHSRADVSQFSSAPLTIIRKTTQEPRIQTLRDVPFAFGPYKQALRAFTTSKSTLRRVLEVPTGQSKRRTGSHWKGPHAGVGSSTRAVACRSKPSSTVFPISCCHVGSSARASEPARQACRATFRPWAIMLQAFCTSENGKES